ncbi:unnamed protein product [Gongylonema pulchrum]|uniref:Cwf21 domain-containing protein n=1 Tax=Gongylonema pulchrum TaxID=637853 RepID=A0A183EWB3_9BILA|nr:unnamed protein product [Gongylonema pulchrum]
MTLEELHRLRELREAYEREEGEKPIRAEIDEMDRMNVELPVTKKHDTADRTTHLNKNEDRDSRHVHSRHIVVSSDNDFSVEF